MPKFIKSIGQFIKRFYPVVVVIGMLTLAIGSLRSYLHINVRQQKIERAKQDAQARKALMKTKYENKMRKEVFADPTKYETSQYENKIEHTINYSKAGIESSAVEPVKVLDTQHKVVKTNPDSFFVTKVINYQSGLVKYVGLHGQYALGWGPTFVQRDYTLAELKKLCPDFSVAKLDAMNALQYQDVSKQQGPIVMTKSVAYGKQKASSKNTVQGRPGQIVGVVAFKTINGRNYVVTPQHTYVEAQRMFLKQHTNVQQ